MATYGSGIRISAAVAASRNSTGTVYTVAASSYAMLNWALVTGGGGTATIEMNGVAFVQCPASTTYSSMMSGISSGLTGSGPIYPGPSQTVNTTIATSGTAYVNGILFSN